MSEADAAFVTGRRLTAIEVSSARTRQAQPGMSAFAATFRVHRSLLVAGDGVPLEEFLARPVEHWVRE